MSDPGSDSPFAGVFFMSPWFDLEGRQPSFRGKLHAESDTVTANFLLHCGALTLDSIEPSDIEEGRKWLLGQLNPAGLDRVVKKVLVYGGGRERLIDDIPEFSGRLKEVFGGKGGDGDETGRHELVVGEFGVHDDMGYDFVVGQGPSEDARRIGEWFCEAFGL